MNEDNPNYKLFIIIFLIGMIIGQLITALLFGPLIAIIMEAAALVVLVFKGEKE